MKTGGLVVTEVIGRERPNKEKVGFVDDEDEVVVVAKVVCFGIFEAKVGGGLAGPESFFL